MGAGERGQGQGQGAVKVVKSGTPLPTRYRLVKWRRKSFAEFENDVSLGGCYEKSVLWAVALGPSRGVAGGGCQDGRLALPDLSSRLAIFGFFCRGLGGHKHDAVSLLAELPLVGALLGDGGWTLPWCAAVDLLMTLVPLSFPPTHRAGEWPLLQQPQ